MQISLLESKIKSEVFKNIRKRIFKLTCRKRLKLRSMSDKLTHLLSSSGREVNQLLPTFKLVKLKIIQFSQKQRVIRCLHLLN